VRSARIDADKQLTNLAARFDGKVALRTLCRYFREPSGGTDSKLIWPVRDAPGDFLPAARKVLDLLEIRFRYQICVGVPAVDSSGEVSPAPRPRGAGRPSTVAPYAPEVARWLREDPNLPGVEILRRVRLAGYRGGKSALYELVKRLRVGASGQPVQTLPAEVTVAVESLLGPGPGPGVTRR
jgi:hypothetical protein